MYTQPHDHGRVYLVPPPGSPGIRQVIDFARYGKTIPHGTLRHSSILSEKWHNGRLEEHVDEGGMWERPMIPTRRRRSVTELFLIHSGIAGCAE